MTSHDAEREVYFDFLNDLFARGEINMCDAAPVMAEFYGLEKAEAMKTLIAWMESFNDLRTY